VIFPLLLFSQLTEKLTTSFYLSSLLLFETMRLILTK